MNRKFKDIFPVFTIVCKVLTSLVVISIILTVLGAVLSVGCSGCVGMSCVGLSLPGAIKK